MNYLRRADSHRCTVSEVAPMYNLTDCKVVVRETRRYTLSLVPFPWIVLRNLKLNQQVSDLTKIGKPRQRERCQSTRKDMGPDPHASVDNLVWKKHEKNREN